MKMPSSFSERLSRFCRLDNSGFCLCVLILQNVVIFWQHILGSAIFLNDFARNIYPMIAFWTTLVQHGVFPEWTSFQTMGMPFVLTMQSGVFYPPLWLFALVKTPFTLHAAAIVQILHVLWGAVGCWCYVRLLGRSRGVALFAAIAFQFFGGFYSNAEHIDIIRAFSYVPWLFWVAHILPQQTTLAWRNWLTPVIVVLAVTGSYQGNLVSHLFMLGVFVVLMCLLQCLYQREQWRQRIVLHGQWLMLFVLGLALSSVYLLPTLAVKSYLARDGVWTGHTMNWPLSYWNTLVMSSDAEGLYVLPSMLSGFVTVPVFCLLFLLNRSVIRQNSMWVMLTLFAWMMASGSQSMIYRSLIHVLPSLGTSRFPSSDYRAILCFGLIVLACGVLEEYLNGRWTHCLSKRFTLCIGMLLFFYLGLLSSDWLSSTAALDVIAWLKQHQDLAKNLWVVVKFVTENTLSAPLREWLVVIALACLVFATLIHYRPRPRQALIVLLLLEMFSGLYFVQRISLYWRNDVATDVFYQKLNRESPYTVMAAIDHPVVSRPACHDMNLFDGSWRGYLLGDYLCQTQDSKTRPREIIIKNPVLNTFMRQSWQARLITPEQLTQCRPESVVQSLGESSATVAAPVQSTSYGLQSVSYHIAATQDFCFVENELLFPGWFGSIANRSAVIQPRAYCGALRSWCLPEGDYNFTASYRAPRLREGAVVSAVFLLLYLVLCARRFYRERKYSTV